MPRQLSPTDIDDFRDRLIDTAERLFAEKGLEAVSLRQLAAELEVSAMTPYRYFADKQAILAAVRVRAFDRFAQALETAFAGEGDLIVRAEAAGQAYVRFAFEHSAAYRLMFDLRQPDEADYPDLVRASARARATLTAHIDALMAAGLLQGDPLLIAHAYWAQLHGLIGLKLADKIEPGVDFAAALDTALNALARGFGARG